MKICSQGLGGFLFLSGVLMLGCLPADAGIVPGGLVLDLQASKGVQLDGAGNVSFWADQSGHGHDAFQGSANARPGFSSNGLNGAPTLTFNGNGQFLDVVGQVITSQQFTIMALVTDNDTTGGLREIFSNWSPSSFTQSIFLGHIASTRMRFSDDFDNVGVVANPTVPSVLTGESSVGDAAVYQDGTLLASKGAPLATRVLNDAYRIGTQGGGFEFWNGNIAAILVYDRALTEAERAQNIQALTSLAPEPSTLASLAVAGLVLGARGLRRLRKS